MYTGPNITTDGLVLYLDATNPKSYPGSGTVWSDLSGNGYTGTLTNGPTFDLGNGGSIQFDGVNDVVNIGTGNTFFPLPQFTIDIWFKSFGTVETTGTTPGLFGFTYGIRSYLNPSSLSFGVHNGTSMIFVTTAGTFRSDNKWYNSVFYHTGTNMGIYINGALTNTLNSTWSGSTIWPTDAWRLGRDNNNNNQHFSGQIPSCKIYNKVLSAEEILQNYNATKSRFNL
jgi:hypothetical protein